MNSVANALAVSGLLALGAPGAFAQSQPAVPMDSEAWRFAIGAGGISAADYPGSSKRRISVVPLLSVNYGRLFVGGTPGAGVPVGLGYNILENSGWKFGVGLGLDLRKPRQESDDPARLSGLGDVPATPHGAVFGSYSQSWLEVRGSVSTDIGGKHEGTLAALDLQARYALAPSLIVSAGPGLTWADSRYSQTFFGIDAAQSANSALAPYAARSGLNSVRFSLGASYQVSPHWFVGARAAAATLRGDARQGPITSDTSQNTYGIYGGYRF